MAIGSEQRRTERRQRIEAQFPSSHIEAALDLLHLTDMAWHDCYGPKELALPDIVLQDVLFLADGDLVALIPQDVGQNRVRAPVLPTFSATQFGARVVSVSFSATPRRLPRAYSRDGRGGLSRAWRPCCHSRSNLPAGATSEAEVH